MSKIRDTQPDGPKVEFPPDVAFQLPPNCPRAHCPAIAEGTTELGRLRRAEEKLKNALAREEALLAAKEELLAQKDLLARESSHRLLNGLQMVASLLSVQSRGAINGEIAAQLRTAAERVATVARVHRRLHVLDGLSTVELNSYLSGLCAEIAMLAKDGPDRAVIFNGVETSVPINIGTPLAFIVSELVTNSTKYGAAHVVVSLQKVAGGASISVTDDGPGLPAGFDPAKSKGLGMTIISTLVRQIGGRLAFERNASGTGTRVTVFFGSAK